MQQKRKSSACGWDSEATRARISVKRNRDIFLKVSRDLQDLGYNWIWEQCRTKIRTICNKNDMHLVCRVEMPCFFE